MNKIWLCLLNYSNSLPHKQTKLSFVFWQRQSSCIHWWLQSGLVHWIQVFRGIYSGDKSSSYSPKQIIHALLVPSSFCRPLQDNASLLHLYDLVTDLQTLLTVTLGADVQTIATPTDYRQPRSELSKWQKNLAQGIIPTHHKHTINTNKICMSEIA